MSKKTKRTVGWVAFYIFVAAFVVLLLLPFIWQFLTSVKPLNEIAEMPAKWIPSYFPWPVLCECIYKASVCTIYAEQSDRGNFCHTAQSADRRISCLCIITPSF